VEGLEAESRDNASPAQLANANTLVQSLDVFTTELEDVGERWEAYEAPKANTTPISTL
jgi:hypothetical protein